MAAGSQDKSVSVWVQGESKPLFVLRRAFRDSISDLAWNREGTCLLAVSLDGTALTVSFTEDEIGRPLSEDKVSSNSLSLRFLLCGASFDPTRKVENGERPRKHKQLNTSVIMRMALTSPSHNSFPVLCRTGTINSGPMVPSGVQVDVLFQELYGDKNARNNVLPEYAEALCESEDGMSIDGHSGAAGVLPPSAATTPSVLMPCLLYTSDAADE